MRKSRGDKAIASGHRLRRNQRVHDGFLHCLDRGGEKGALGSVGKHLDGHRVVPTLRGAGIRRRQRHEEVAALEDDAFRKLVASSQATGDEITRVAESRRHEEDGAAD